MFLSLFKTDDAYFVKLYWQLVFRKFSDTGSRVKLYIWKIHKIHKLQSALWRNTFHVTFPGFALGFISVAWELVLCLLVSGVKGTTVSYLFPFAVGLGRWIPVARQIIPCSFHLSANFCLTEKHFIFSLMFRLSPNHQLFSDLGPSYTIMFPALPPNHCSPTPLPFLPPPNLSRNPPRPC